MGQKHDKKLWTREVPLSLSQEDECLKRAIDIAGDDKWNQVSLKFNQIFLATYGYKSDRLGKQCRERYLHSLKRRWYNKLSPALRTNHQEWTPEQHRVLIDAFSQNGSRWSKIIQLLFETFSIRRSDNGIKNHFHTLIKKGMKELCQFIDQYNEDCKKKGLFEQKPKKKYFYPKQLSLEKELRNKKKNHKLFSQQLPEIPQKILDQEQAPPVELQNVENIQVQNQKPSLSNSTQQPEKQSVIIKKKEEEGTMEKIDSTKQEFFEALNSEHPKYLTPLKQPDKKIVDRLLFVVLERNLDDSQEVDQMLPDQNVFIPVRKSFLEFIKDGSDFNFQQTKQLAEGLSNYTQYFRKAGKKITCVKKSKKPQQDFSYLDIHRTSRKLFEKIKLKYPEHEKAFSVGKHKILARINVLVGKTRQRQIDMQEEVKKKYLLRKQEEQIITGNIIQEALIMYKMKKQETKKKKQEVWKQKRIQRQEELEIQKEVFIANGGTLDEFQTIQEENRRLRIENQRLKAKIQSQQDKMEKSSKRRRIIRDYVPKTKPIRKNKDNSKQKIQESSHNMNPHNEFSFGLPNQHDILVQKTFEKISFCQKNEEKDTENIFPFLSNGIREIPMESYSFFEGYNRVRQNQMKPNPYFFDNIRSVPIIHENRPQPIIKQEFHEQKLFSIPQKDSETKKDKNFILKTQEQKNYFIQSNLPSKPVEVQNTIKKYPSSELIFKIPIKRPLDENIQQSQNSSHSFKSKKSIRPKILIRQEDSKPEVSSSGFFNRKESSLKNFQKRDSSFSPQKKDLPDFLARSIELAVQQNELNRSWKFNLQQDSNSPINSNKSNFFAFVPEVKQTQNQSNPASNAQFFKQLNSSQQFIGQNPIFHKVGSTNYNRPPSIYKSCDFMAMSCQNLGHPKVSGQGMQSPQKFQEKNVEVNSFIKNIRKIEESQGSQWNQPNVYHFMNSIPEKIQKDPIQTPVSNHNKGFTSFNMFNSQPIDFEIPQKLIETAKNNHFPIRNYNDYSLNYHHANSMEYSKVFEFDKKFGFNSAIISEMELFRSEDRNEENRSRSKEFDLGSNMFKSQRIQSMHDSCGFLNKSRQLSNSCIYSNHDEKSVAGGRQPDYSKNPWNNPEEKPKK